MDIHKENRLKGSWKIFNQDDCIARLSNIRFDPPFYSYSIKWLTPIEPATADILNGNTSDKFGILKITSCVDGEIMNPDHYPSIIQDEVFIIRDCTPTPVGFLERIFKNIINKLKI